MAAKRQRSGEYSHDMRKAVGHGVCPALLLLAAGRDFYICRRKWPPLQQLPLKGIFQGIKLVSAILVGILIISLLIGQSPAILISGLGAMAAVLMLVFKDPILGLVAGIQLSANDMLKLGDCWRCRNTVPTAR